MISGDLIFNILYISVASNQRFLSWSVTDLSLEKSFSNDEKLFLGNFLCPHEIYPFAMNYPGQRTIFKL